MTFTAALSSLPRNRRLLFAFCVLGGLSGCADVSMPDIVFDDGPAPAATLTDKDPQAVLTGQRPVRRADPHLAQWPSLAAVPPRPQEFSTPAERQTLLDRLQADRSQGEAAAGQLRQAPTSGRAIDPGTGLPAVPDQPPPPPAPIPQ